MPEFACCSRRWWLAGCMGAAVGCRRATESFPMPRQKRWLHASDPRQRVIKFNDPDIGEYVVRDIQPGTPASWTFDHPEMTFPVEPRAGLRFVMRFGIHERTFRDTGPVTVSVKINGHALGSLYCKQPNDYTLDLPVPLDWIEAGEPVHVLAEASPLWIAPDGVRLGYLIEEAGFRW